VSEQACPQDRWDPFKTESDGDSLWTSVDGALVGRMGLSMVRQLALPGVGSRIVTTPIVAVADVLPCTALLWFARHLL
jgi:hypothetical protein